MDVVVEVIRDGLEVIRGAEQGEQLAEQHDAAVIEGQTKTIRVQTQEYLPCGGWLGSSPRASIRTNLRVPVE